MLPSSIGNQIVATISSEDRQPPVWDDADNKVLLRTLDSLDDLCREAPIELSSDLRLEPVDHTKVTRDYTNLECL
jgi:hypothetical protein